MTRHDDDADAGLADEQTWLVGPDQRDRRGHRTSLPRHPEPGPSGRPNTTDTCTLVASTSGPEVRELTPVRRIFLPSRPTSGAVGAVGVARRVGWVSPSSQQHQAALVARNAASGVVFLTGAGLYAPLQRSGTVDFNTTPFSVGVIAIIAGLASNRRRAIATGLVLAGWGAAVLLVAHGAVSAERTTPAYMLGIGAGLVATAVLAPKAQRGEWLTSGAIAAALGPLGLYLSYDVGSLGRWPVWALTLLALAVWELFWGVGSHSAREATAAR